VVSDTHLADGEMLPHEVIATLDGVDMIFHAGDLVGMGVVEQLEEIAPLFAVCGNMDGQDVRDRLPDQRIVAADGLRIGLIHGRGRPESLIQWVREAFDDPVDAVIFGHSHSPMNTVVDGVLMFNPGSPTDRRSAPYRSCGIIELVHNTPPDAKIVRLP
jgi:putative phosphoesterase